MFIRVTLFAACLRVGGDGKGGRRLAIAFGEVPDSEGEGERANAETSRDIVSGDNRGLFIRRELEEEEVESAVVFRFARESD